MDHSLAQMILSFAVHKLFSFMKPHLLIVDLTASAFMILFRTFFLILMSSERILQGRRNRMSCWRGDGKMRIGGLDGEGNGRAKTSGNARVNS